MTALCISLEQSKASLSDTWLLLLTVGEIYPVVETDQFTRNYGSADTCHLLWWILKWELQRHHCCRCADLPTHSCGDRDGILSSHCSACIHRLNQLCSCGLKTQWIIIHCIDFCHLTSLSTCEKFQAAFPPPLPTLSLLSDPPRLDSWLSDAPGWSLAMWPRLFI